MGMAAEHRASPHWTRLLPQEDQYDHNGYTSYVHERNSITFLLFI